jgi:hypothetical protein
LHIGNDDGTLAFGMVEEIGEIQQAITFVRTQIADR